MNMDIVSHWNIILDITFIIGGKCRQSILFLSYSLIALGGPGTDTACSMYVLDVKLSNRAAVRWRSLTAQFALWDLTVKDSREREYRSIVIFNLAILILFVWNTSERPRI